MFGDRALNILDGPGDRELLTLLSLTFKGFGFVLFV